MAKVLFVEDDAALAMGVEFSLQQEGYEVRHAGTVKEAVEVMQSMKGGDRYDIALFDVMLPDGNGYELIQRFRREGVDLPVIFLTAVSDEVNVVQGLELGADDYVTKPFRVKELLSRMKAVLRRSGQMAGGTLNAAVNGRGTVAAAGTPEAAGMQTTPFKEGISSLDSVIGEEYAAPRKGAIQYGELCVDFDRAEITLLGEEVHLTRGEYKMFLFFLKNQGIALTRNMILERLFDDGSNYVDDNTLSVYVNRLREKIGDTRRKKPYIKTVRGIGYMMERLNV